MKTLFTFLVLISSFASFAQSDKVEGDYELKLVTTANDLLEYKLTLNSDGTFFFHYYKNIKQGNPPEENKYAKGKWTVEKNLVSFSTDKQTDFDEKYTLNFANSTARFIMKSPRDKTDHVIDTKLVFLNSEILWIKGIKMLKM